MTASEYYDQYPSDDTETIEEIIANQWIRDMDTFLTLLRVCPFPISKEAKEWLNSALLDI